MQVFNKFWLISNRELMIKLGSQVEGLSHEEALSRLREQMKNKPQQSILAKNIRFFLSQYKSPLVLLLVFASVLALLLREYSDSLIVLIILSLTGLLSFVQERKAEKAVAGLKAMVQSKATVRRQKGEKEIPMEEVVPGDIIILDAGDIIPADAVILESKDLHVNEAILTGESYPAEKAVGSCPADVVLSKVHHAVFKGTNVVSGTAIVMAVNTDKGTQIGDIASSIRNANAETVFEKGIRRFGFLLMRVAIVFVLLILTANILLKKPVIDSMLFALALAVGMTPELLPAILTITLSEGARRMAAKKVIVKKLAAIQNLGEMNILCSDKTGTLTEGTVRVHGAKRYDGTEDRKILQYAYLNACFETGFSNPIDYALRNISEYNTGAFTKLDEVPYDFIRKRLSVLVTEGEKSLMITKGAVDNVLACCTKGETGKGVCNIGEMRGDILQQYQLFGNQGFRAIAVSYKNMGDHRIIKKEDETDMIFLGFVTLFDPPKKGISDSLQKLTDAGIKLKIISGDNKLVVKYLAGRIGLNTDRVLTGSDLIKMSEDALQQKLKHIDIFAEIEPMQKERILKSLQKDGQAVGFLGDGINDAGAIKTADVGISVDSASDIAKEVADIVLLDKSIDVIYDGVIEGRKTFINTMKYIYVNTSANFGNMLSMAVASLLLPFLPLLATQVLLNNFLSDIPALAIGTDNVDEEHLQKPLRWDLKYIQRFMTVFGLQSSVFDFLTFGTLLYLFHASVEEFRTGWFTESLITQMSILLIIRTQRSFWKSRPGKWLLIINALIFSITVALPYTPFSKYFELYPMPYILLISMVGIAVIYLVMAEATKKLAFKKFVNTDTLKGRGHRMPFPKRMKPVGINPL